MTTELSEELYEQVHRDAVAFRRKKFEEITSKENPTEEEVLMLKEWARMFWRDFI